jgi:hypothetical protein
MPTSEIRNSVRSRIGLCRQEQGQTYQDAVVVVVLAIGQLSWKPYYLAVTLGVVVVCDPSPSSPSLTSIVEDTNKRRKVRAIHQ